MVDYRRKESWPQLVIKTVRISARFMELKLLVCGRYSSCLPHLKSVKKSAGNLCRVVRILYSLKAGKTPIPKVNMVTDGAMGAAVGPEA